MSNILDVVVADRNLATLLKNVKAAGLDADLIKTDPLPFLLPQTWLLESCLQVK
jgi:hypothetical protein